MRARAKRTRAHLLHLRLTYQTAFASASERGRYRFYTTCLSFAGRVGKRMLKHNCILICVYIQNLLKIGNICRIRRTAEYHQHQRIHECYMWQSVAVIV